MEQFVCLFDPQYVSAWGVIGLCVFISFVFFRLLLLAAHLSFRTSKRVLSVINAVRVPGSLLSLIIGLISAFSFLNLPSNEYNELLYFMRVTILLLIGWFVIRVLGAVINYQIARVNSQGHKVKRTALTQLNFSYRLGVVIVLFLILGGIFFISPGLKTLGMGLLGSAGIAGLALGIAAQPLLQNLMAGFQIVMNRTLNIGDALFIHGDYCIVEQILMTQVVLRTWDGRRLVVPVSKFIQDPFQNWDLNDSSKIGRVSIFCDYRVPVDELRSYYEKMIQKEPLFNGAVYALFVFDTSPQAVEIVCQLSAPSPPELFLLKCRVRENMLTYIQKNHPYALPHTRYIKEQKK